MIQSHPFRRFTMSIVRLTGPALVVAAGLSIVAADVADARIGGGRSFGSRGSRTFNAPPATNTAPSVAPIDRSITQRTAPSAAQSPRPGAQGAGLASRFGGWRGILAGGLFVAALGSIFGFGALASVLGFLLQMALIGGLVYLAVSFFRSRSQPTLARAPVRASGARPDPAAPRPSSFGASGSVPAAASSTLTIGKDDLDQFERLLGEIQSAYSREDTEQLGEKTTPEMLSNLLRELSDLEKDGKRNEISDVKLLQGDLAEAWREDGSDYATVAIRYALKDIIRDRATGRVMEGDSSEPTEVTELWTFRRDDRAPEDGWQLSAIQQAA
jgi:predicted lipid-binding transport protein (Tim44 family)